MALSSVTRVALGESLCDSVNSISTSTSLLGHRELIVQWRRGSRVSKPHQQQCLNTRTTWTDDFGRSAAHDPHRRKYFMSSSDFSTPCQPPRTQPPRVHHHGRPAKSCVEGGEHQATARSYLGQIAIQQRRVLLQQPTTGLLHNTGSELLLEKDGDTTHNDSQRLVSALSRIHHHQHPHPRTDTNRYEQDTHRYTQIHTGTHRTTCNDKHKRQLH